MNREAAPFAPAEPTFFEGGALHRLLAASPFARRWVEPPARLAALAVAVAWLPLLVGATLGGLLAEGTAVPFARDLQTHARLLLALPLLLLAQRPADRIYAATLRAFVERGIVRERERERFESLVAAAGRVVASPAIEVTLVAVVLVAGQAVWKAAAMHNVGAWYGAPSGDDFRLTPIGYWFAWVSVPLFQLVQLRWIFRFVNLGALLWRVSRLDLALTPAHPDRAAGLGFIGTKLHAFHPFLFAQGVAVAGILAERIFHEGARLDAFVPEIAAIVVAGLVLVLGPPTVFAARLVAAKREGRRAYGDVANRYVREFDRKWVHGGAAPDEALVGSPDVQSLADLANSYDVVTRMRAVPYGRDRVIAAAAALLLPISPLLLTLVPARELLRRLLQLLL